MLFKKTHWDKISQVFQRGKINDLIFFVTSRCNSRCQTCFFWRSLNRGRDLALEEIAKISKSMPTFNSLLISGGEPFLRDDLPAIVEFFYRNNKIRLLGIPTNGLLTQKIVTLTKKILKILPKATVSINFSLDGLAKTHDDIRGVSGNFEKSLKGIKKLCALRQFFPNLEIKINTVICRDNFDQILPLAKFVLKNLNVDGHYFELIRGDLSDKKIKLVPKDKLRELYQNLLKIQSKAFFKRHRPRSFAYKQLNYLIFLSRLIFLYRIQLDNYLDKKRWPMSCLAGKTMLVLGSQGELAACELRKDIANIKDFDYDFDKFWHSKSLKNERKKIAKANCDCTHVCFIDTSFIHEPWLAFFKLPMLYLKYQLFGFLN